MLPPEKDLVDRKPIWNCMQNFWMDTDPEIFLPQVVAICSKSKYSTEELEAIYWNEVYPAISFNLGMAPAPEWSGLELEWLSRQILKKHRFGKHFPPKWLDPYSRKWWHKLEQGLTKVRKTSSRGFC